MEVREKMMQEKESLVLLRQRRTGTGRQTDRQRKKDVSENTSLKKCFVTHKLRTNLLENRRRETVKQKDR